MLKYETGYEQLEQLEAERDYFGSKIDAEILRINVIQVPKKLRTLKIGTSSQHEKNKDIMDRQLDNYLANLE